MSTKKERTTLTLFQKGIVLVSVTLAFELVFLATLCVLLMKAQAVARHQSDAKESIAQANDIYKLSYDSWVTLFAYGLTKNKLYSRRYEEQMKDMSKTIHALKVKTIYTPRLKARILRIELLKEEMDSLLSPVKEGLDQGELAPLKLVSSDFKARLEELTTTLVSELHKFTEQQEKIELADPRSESRSNALIYQCITVGVVLNVLLAIFLVLVFHRGTTQRLNSLLENTALLAKRKPLNPPLTGNDEIAHLDQVFHNMANELSEAIRKEQAVVQHAVDVICSIDAHGRFTAVNPAANTVWGFHPNDLIGKQFIELVIPEDLEMTSASVKAVIGVEGTSSFENRIKRSDGTVVDMLWSTYWSQAEQSLFCVVHDITERRELDRLKQEFFAMVSHDLRSPLTAIQAFLMMLSEGKYGELTSKGASKVVSADRSATRLLALVNDLLDLDKLESGKFDMEFNDIPISSVIDRSLDAIRTIAEQKGIVFETTKSTEQVYADADRLIQVLVNLLGNAVKYSPPGESVIISVNRLGDLVEVRVTDKGRGIPAHLKGAIFERFKQVDARDRKEKGGSGLGLAISKSLIEQQGGTIGVDSDDGQGSSFWFRIPATMAPVKN